MPQKGPHTWDMFHDYRQCPYCKFIQESRTPFLKKEKEVYSKQLTCSRCHRAYTVTTPAIRRFSGETAEITWE